MSPRVERNGEYLETILAVYDAFGPYYLGNAWAGQRDGFGHVMSLCEGSVAAREAVGLFAHDVWDAYHAIQFDPDLWLFNAPFDWEIAPAVVWHFWKDATAVPTPSVEEIAAFLRGINDATIRATFTEAKARQDARA